MRPAAAALAPSSLALSALVLTGCTTAPAETAPAQTTQPASTTSSAPTEDTHELTITVNGTAVPTAPDGTPDYCATLEEPTGSAADRYGAPQVHAAVCDVVTFLLAQGATEEVTGSEEPSTDEEQVASLAYVKDFLTPEASESWDEAAQQTTGEIDHSLATVALLAQLPYGTDTYASAAGQGRAYSTASLDVGQVWLSDTTGEGRLSIKIDSVTDVDVTRTTDDTDWVVPYERTLTLTLVPTQDPDHPWLIDAWNGHFDVGDPQDRHGNPAETPPSPTPTETPTS